MKKLEAVALILISFNIILLVLAFGKDSLEARGPHRVETMDITIAHQGDLSALKDFLAIGALEQIYQESGSKRRNSLDIHLTQTAMPSLPRGHWLQVWWKLRNRKEPDRGYTDIKVDSPFKFTVLIMHVEFKEAVSPIGAVRYSASRTIEQCLAHTHISKLQTWTVSEDTTAKVQAAVFEINAERLPDNLAPSPPPLLIPNPPNFNRPFGAPIQARLLFINIVVRRHKASV